MWVLPKPCITTMDALLDTQLHEGISRAGCEIEMRGPRDARPIMLATILCGVSVPARWASLQPWASGRRWDSPRRM